MKYVKIKDNKGDFNSFEAGVLHEALITELGPQESINYTGDRWYLRTNKIPGVVQLIVLDESLDTSGVDKVMKDHFKKDWTDYNPEAEAKAILLAKINKAKTIDELKDFMKEQIAVKVA